MGKIVQIRERLFKAAAGGKKVYRFESGDPSFDIAPAVLEGIIAAAKAGKTHYIPNDGIPELKRELKAKLERKNGIVLDSADRIHVTNGAMHALYVVWQCLLDDGDEVIVPDPMWTEAVENARLAGGVPVPVILDHEHGYTYSAAAIEAKITSRTKAIFVNSPHNPTGMILSRDELMAILELAKKRDLFIVTDEAYEDVLYGTNKHYSLAALCQEKYGKTLAENPYLKKIISVYSFSKSYAMSGMRVGYIAIQNDPIQERISKLLRCTINGVNSVAQWAAIEAVKGEAVKVDTGHMDHIQMMRSEYTKRRQLMLDALAGVPGLHPFAPQGAFYVWCKLDPSFYTRMGVKDADDFSNLLAGQGIGNAPGDSFGVHCHGAIRFAFSCATPMVVEGSAVLKQVLHK